MPFEVLTARIRTLEENGRRFDEVVVEVPPGPAPSGVLLPRYGEVVQHFAGYDITGCPAYMEDCDARGHVKVVVEPRGGKAKTYDDVGICFAPVAVFLPPAGGRVTVRAVHGYRYAVQNNPVLRLLPPMAREERPRAIVLEVNDAYRAWLASACTASRAWEVAARLAARIGSGAAFRAPIVLDGGAAVAEKMPVPGDAIVNIAALPVVVAHLHGPLSRLDLAEAACEVTHLGAEVEICSGGKCVRKRTVPTSVWDRRPAVVLRVRHGAVNASMRPLGYTDRATDEHGVVEDGVAVWDGGASRRLAAGVLFSTAPVSPATVPRRLRLCLGVEDSIHVDALVRTRVSIPELGVEAELAPGRHPVRVPYRAALAAARGGRLRVRAVLEALEGFIPRPVVLKGAATYSVEGDTVYVAPAVRVEKARPRAEIPMDIELLAPRLSARLDAPDYMEPLETGEALLRVANTGTCRGRFAASLAGAGSEKMLSPGEHMELKRRLEMHAGDIAIDAYASLELPGGERVEWRRRHTVRMINTVWLHGGILEARGGPAPTRVRVAVAGLTVRARAGEASVLSDLPLPAAAATLELKPRQRVEIASVTMPQAVVVLSDRPIWLAVNDRPVKRDTRIVWASGPAGKLVASMLEERLG